MSLFWKIKYHNSNFYNYLVRLPVHKTLIYALKKNTAIKHLEGAFNLDFSHEESTPKRWTTKGRRVVGSISCFFWQRTLGWKENLESGERRVWR